MDKAKDMAFIETPEEWPRWPWLPVKRYSAEGGFPQCGVMMAQEGIRYFVFDAFLTDLPKSFAALMATNRWEYKSAQEVVDDGWTID